MRPGSHFCRLISLSKTFQPRSPPALVLSLSPGLGPDGLPSPGGYVSHPMTPSSTVSSSPNPPASRDSPALISSSATALQCLPFLETAASNSASGIFLK
jgi:hypothetical protein